MFANLLVLPALVLTFEKKKVAKEIEGKTK
jgi:hypothetical protein